jgi:fermentation-respiration switch protein FrsA (DUF1100 family)
MLLKWSCIGLTLVAGLVYFNQRKLIYPSNMPEGARENVDTPSMHGFTDDQWEELSIKTPDGIHLQAYFIKQASSTPTTAILYCQANAGNIGHRIPIARMLYRRFHCHVFMFSYRGYGKSQGYAYEQGIKIDAATMLKYLKGRSEVRDVVVFGQSIGGAVAIDLVASHEQDVKALVVENTFTSVPDLVPFVIPMLRYFTFLCTEKWWSLNRIRLIERIPVLFLVGDRDELIPPFMSKKLFDAVKTTKKEIVTIQGGMHNDTCIKPDYWTHLIAFWKKQISMGDE